ncbi:tumor necrosis factor receptor superfamily member 14 isoform 3-T3 [Phoenicopterus ruber ruber]
MLSPAARNAAYSFQKLVFAVVLVTQLDGADALECGLGEYPIGAECCPMCAAGLRVFKHCTASSSTTCIPCVEDTYTDHPNGLEHCRKCKLCDKGANLVPEVACTYTKNTVCGCPPGYFCSYVGPEDCELCQRYTVCFPGTMVKERGTKTTDNVCVACPPGTSSTANMSYSCTPRSELENGPGQGEDGKPSSGSSVPVIVGSVVGTALVGGAAALLIYIWKRRKRKNYVPLRTGAACGCWEGPRSRIPKTMRMDSRVRLCYQPRRTGIKQLLLCRKPVPILKKPGLNSRFCLNCWRQWRR